jgi:prefoldin subunit 5
MPSTQELLQARFDELAAAKAAIRAETEPLKLQRAQLFESIAPIQAQIEELSNRIAAVNEEKKLFEVSRELAAVAKALGAVSMTEV